MLPNNLNEALRIGYYHAIGGKVERRERKEKNERGSNILLHLVRRTKSGRIKN